MSNPVLVEVVRGARVESEHRGRVAVMDSDGAAVLAWGDVSRPIFPRSAVKPLQALPLVESGAADGFGFGHEELALASASHSGEPAHVAVVEHMLARAGLDAAALALARSGREPTPLHNNCSGKHAGFLCAACGVGAEPAGYARPDHPVQRAVRAALEGLTGVAIGEGTHAIDGCSVPTWPLPLERLAYAFARFGTGQGLGAERIRAAGRIRTACAARPYLVAGTGRFCTRILEHFGDRVLVKAGAEGVLCAAFPELGLGVAIKCDDGAGRAAEVVLAGLILRLLRLEEADHAALAPLARPILRNWNGIEIGMLRATEILAQHT